MSRKILDILFLGWFFLLIGTSPILALQASSSDSLVIDTGQVQLWQKIIPEERIDNYRQQSAFNYDFTEVKQESIWDRFKQWFRNWVNILRNSLGVVWYLRYIIFAAFIIFFIVLIYRGKFTGLFSSPQEIAGMEFSETTNPTKVNWEQKIKEAFVQKEYRLAVRYHFLSLLKNLSTHKLIAWKLEKTNYDYSREIKQNTIKDNFIELSELYEAVWYGNFPIAIQDYQQIDDEFARLNLILSQTKQFAS